VVTHFVAECFTRAWQQEWESDDDPDPFGEVHTVCLTIGPIVDLGFSRRVGPCLVSVCYSVSRWTSWPLSLLEGEEPGACMQSPQTNCKPESMSALCMCIIWGSLVS
jgi:hypothetical protein